MDDYNVRTSIFITWTDRK